MKLKKYFLIILFVLSEQGFSQTVSLAGTWRFAIDRNDLGEKEKWFTKVLQDSVRLPGSMLENNKGDAVTLQTKWTGSIYDSSWYFNPRYEKYRQPNNLQFPFWLTPNKTYVGVAWYQKEITIGSSLLSKNIELFLERCHTETTVWIDGNKVGIQNSFVAPHVYNISNWLSKGKHLISIRMDNRIKEINVGPDSHSLTDHTQGNWNGIVGKIEIRTAPICYIKDVQVYPDIDQKLAKVQVKLSGNTQLATAIKITAQSFNSKQRHIVIPVSSKLTNTTKDSVELTLNFGSAMQLWSEFSPTLYRVEITLSNADGTEEKKQIEFGMRSFHAKGKQFEINHRTTFLRGTVENCVFPLTGYASMQEKDWEKIFLKCKSYGLNHMRFHSYCPPEAAFAAADRVGIYLQPEGPSWANHGTSLGDGKPVDQFLYEETALMAKYYGNHPSFCMMAYGNEPRGGRQVEWLTKFINYWKEKDSRRTYTGASVGMSWPLVPANEYMVKSGARNLAWNKMPESISDYSTAINAFQVPYIAHEMGQWCVFPNFKEIKKYTGVYKAKNFELFQEDLKDAGMLDQAENFLASSGKLQLLCYKHEIEKSLRTPLNGGFQLLSLTDYPGQGTALVGVLDAFWEEKGYANAADFSQFCNATVPLLKTEKFVYKNKELFKAAVDIFHYGNENIKKGVVYWRLIADNGKLLIEGKFPATAIETGKNNFIGNISIDLSDIKDAISCKLEVGILNTTIKNDWGIWIYPDLPNEPWKKDIYYCTSLDEGAKKVLENGGKVFLNTNGQILKGKEVVQHFLPVFWNTSWFKMRPPHTLGILADPHHHAFKNFPTKNHSDLQWWDIINNSQVMHLEDFPKDFRPIVQPIDTWFLNRRLAMVFEATMGKGKIMVSSANLSDTSTGLASRQLFASLIAYMQTENFEPKQAISQDMIYHLITQSSKFSFDAYTKSSPDELRPKQILKQ